MKKIRDVKALARETLIGKYGTVIGAYFLSGILVFLSGLLALFCILAAFANTNRFEPVVRRVIPSFQKIPALSVICAVLFAAFAVFTFILSCWLKFGRQKLILNICRGEKFGCRDIFYAFKRGSHPWRVIGVNLLSLIFVNAVYIIPAVLSLAAGACGYELNYQCLSSPFGIAVFAADILALLLSFWLSVGFIFADTVIIDRPEARAFEALRDSLHITKHKKLKLFWMVSFSFFFWYLLISIVKIASLWVLPYIESSVIIFYLCARGEEFVIPANRPKTEHSPEKAEAPAEAAEFLEAEVPYAEAVNVSEAPEPVIASESFEESVPEKVHEINGEEIIITEDEV